VPGVTPSRGVYDEGSLIASAPPNFVGAGVSSAYNSGTGRVDVTISGGGSSTRTPADYDLKLDFGAVGDGTTNDTTAVQNALDTVKSGYYLNVPRGTYLIDPVTVTEPLGMSIVGQGPSYSVFKQRQSGQTGTLFTLNRSVGVTAPSESHSLIRGIGFYGKSSSYTAKGVYAELMAYIQFDWCKFTGFTDALYAGASLVFAVTNSWFLSTSGAGILFEGSVAGDNHILLQNLVMRAHSAYAINYGGTLGAGSGLTVSHVDIESCAGGIRLGGSAGPYSQYAPNRVRDCWFEGNSGAAIDVTANSSTALIEGNYILGNGTNNYFNVAASRARPTIIQHNTIDTFLTTNPYFVVNGSGSHPVVVRENTLRTEPGTGSSTGQIVNSGSGLVSTSNWS
jgi:hypothetical protein